MSAQAATLTRPVNFAFRDDVMKTKPHIYMVAGRWHVALDRKCTLRDSRAARLWVDARNAMFKSRLELVP